MFYLLIFLLQMKLIKIKTDLIKAIEFDKRLGFVPTMGALHEGHKALIKTSQKNCKKTLVSIFINPTQFNNKKDFKTYPKNLKKDLIYLKKLKVDYVYLPTVKQIYWKKNDKIKLNKLQNILCAKFRKGHFEGVLDVLDRFIELISPQKMFMGEKDFQQFFLVKNFIENKYNTKVYICKTIRNKNNLALSSRNSLLNKQSFAASEIITKKLLKLKKEITRNTKNYKKLIFILKKELFKNFDIKIEYLECRNTHNLSTNILNKPFKLFVAYYIDNVRLIDNF
ncbi:pantoate--beta-alanine ligase [Candidatus Pelagibacter giovannonii]|uniref:Pantothenate synthetase n=1 Tax=Candidatus Pelagibacter giovannonii TaxID=2563896 RepID=A0A6H1Q0I3_9PROT|nr:pantoate--beta-alanine ligase [Candidatus Pelagibacter giovannonii]QIZ20291.1 pantoate--beta-alanine ligase [Candidatus Pelagibacter giovannonii]